MEYTLVAKDHNYDFKIQFLLQHSEKVSEENTISSNCEHPVIVPLQMVRSHISKGIYNCQSFVDMLLKGR